MNFEQYLKECASSFNQIDKKEVIRVISHLDTDGICAAAIFTKALIREKRKFSITFVDFLTEDFIKALSNDPCKFIAFLDLGTSQINNIKKYLKEKKMFVLDHHSTRIRKVDDEVFHLNPRIFEIDGSKDISGAGLTYLFAKELNDKNSDLAYLGVVGAIGDSQEQDGFKGLNCRIMEDAINSKKIQLQKGVRFFGTDTRPLFKLLKNSVDFYLPGITGNDDRAIDFLHYLGIESKRDGRWTKLSDLKEEELNKLLGAISSTSPTSNVATSSTSSSNEEKQAYLSNDQIFSTRYIVSGFPSDISDAMELSTMLNACGRLDRASHGLGMLLGDKKCLIRATYTLKEYRREILNSLKWVEANLCTSKAVNENGYMIINAKDSLSPKILGVVVSLLSMNRDYDEGTYLLALSRARSNKIKISMRVVGNKTRTSLAKMVEKIVEPFGGEYGGHHHSAGGLIDMKHEKQFLELAANELSKKSMEEVIE